MQPPLRPSITLGGANMSGRRPAGSCCELAGAQSMITDITSPSEWVGRYMDDSVGVSRRGGGNSWGQSLLGTTMVSKHRHIPIHIVL